MQALTILIILATRAIFGQAQDYPKGLAQISVGDGRYYFSPNLLVAPAGTRIRFYFYGVSSSCLSILITFTSKPSDTGIFRLTCFLTKRTILSSSPPSKLPAARPLTRFTPASSKALCQDPWLQFILRLLSMTRIRFGSIAHRIMIANVTWWGSSIRT